MVEIHTLKNGITVLLETVSHFSSVGVGVWIKVGSKYETKENNGISHLIEHMLFKGTSTRSVNDISKETAFMGGNLNAYTSKELTSLYTRVLPEHLFMAIDLISDMICNSIIDEEELEREKGVVCEEIDMYKDSPDDYVHEKLQKQIWKDHPLGYYISGEKKLVKSFNREMILDYIKNHYNGKNMVISVAGNFNKQETVSYIEKSFNSIEENNRNVEIEIPKYYKAKNIDKRDIEQLHMNIAFRGANLKSNDRYAFTVLNTIFGGDVNSRLFREIREKRGLTYSVYSYGCSYSEAGLMQIYAAMNQEQLENVYCLITKLVDNLIKDGVTKEELEAAKHQITVEMTLNKDNIMNKMSGNAKSFLNYGEVIPFDNTISSINNVTLDDMEYIIGNYIIKEEMSIGIVGPIEKQNFLC